MGNGLGSNQITTNFNSNISSMSEVTPEEAKPNSLPSGTIDVLKEIPIPENIRNSLNEAISMNSTFTKKTSDKIDALIKSKLGSALSGSSNLGLKNRMLELNKTKCNIGDIGLSFALKGANLDLQGYTLAGLLAMLICSGVEKALEGLNILINNTKGIIASSVYAKAISNTIVNDINPNSISFIDGLTDLEILKDIKKAHPEVSKNIVSYISQGIKTTSTGADFEKALTGIKKISSNIMESDTDADINLTSFKDNLKVSKLAEKAEKTKIPTMSGEEELTAPKPSETTLIGLAKYMT